MEVGNHLRTPATPPGMAADQVVLIAIVDAHIRISRPDQDGIDAAVALFEIVEVSVHRVLARDRIVEYRSCTIICGWKKPDCVHLNAGKSYLTSS